MNKEDLIKLVASLSVVNLSANKSALGVITGEGETSVSMSEHMKFSGELNTAVMIDWLHKKATDQLTTLRITNATYEVANILPNVMIDMKSTAEKFFNLSNQALEHMAADYAKNQMGES